MDLCPLYQRVRNKVKFRATKQSAVASHSATLATLPPEILSLILGHLCKHCSRPADLELSGIDDGKLALKSLCLVCRALRRPAQAFLVHSLWLRFGLRGYRTGKDDSNFAVLRTLIACPDLAASVRKITLGGSEMVLRRERLEAVRDAERQRTFQTVATLSYEVDDVSFTRLTRDLFVSLAHNLTDLSFPLGFRRGEQGAADRAAAVRHAQYAKMLNSGAIMPALQTLTLFPERISSFVLNDPRICLFLCAAPNLRRLVIDEVEDLVEFTTNYIDPYTVTAQQIHPGLFLHELPTMQHLHSIHLQNCIVADDAPGRNLAGLQTLIAIAPNLRRFQFSAGPSFQHPMIASSRVLSLLEPLYDTLLDLGLRFDASVTYLDDGDHTDSLESLARFNKLCVLRLDEAAYCHSRHPGQPNTDSRNRNSGGESVPPECLTMIVPQSVQVLHLELMYGCTKQCDALHLAAQVADGQFPNLLHVQIEAVLRTPPHGAVQLRNVQQAIDAGWLEAAGYESDVVAAFLESNVGVWLRNAGSFDDLDAGACVNVC
ncbi:hypothetical protein LEL_00028 [Akanthomyces lecanii RCEF 1005]|uniref:F-box domain-containing protein n=1 Tax=Akanthomyces lecanii RCEF 1005 TaxID=1081108 RepID=A0A168JIH8_CORDF|nr:hypothetical protein LEL_00028 [Akanthomyces lecanii RCEF 1005]